MNEIYFISQMCASVRVKSLGVCLKLDEQYQIGWYSWVVGTLCKQEQIQLGC